MTAARRRSFLALLVTTAATVAIGSAEVRSTGGAGTGVIEYCLTAVAEFVSAFKPGMAPPLQNPITLMGVPQ